MSIHLLFYLFNWIFYISCSELKRTIILRIKTFNSYKYSELLQCTADKEEGHLFAIFSLTNRNNLHPWLIMIFLWLLYALMKSTYKFMCVFNLKWGTVPTVNRLSWRLTFGKWNRQTHFNTLFYPSFKMSKYSGQSKNQPLHCKSQFFPIWLKTFNLTLSSIWPELKWAPNRHTKGQSGGKLDKIVNIRSLRNLSSFFFLISEYTF